MKPLSHPVIFHPPTNGLPQLFFDPNPPVLGQFFIHCGIMMKNMKLSKKAFLPVSLHRAIKGQGHGQGL